MHILIDTKFFLLMTGHSLSILLSTTKNTFEAFYIIPWQRTQYLQMIKSLRKEMDA